jgi:hypothetical protein
MCFGVRVIDYLGHKIMKNCISPTLEKVKAIENFKRPSDAEGVRRFLGLTNF